MHTAYSVLFADADNTLFDFTRAQAHAFRACMRTLGVEPDEAMIRRYSHINDTLWKAFERGETTQDRLRVDRFAQLLGECGLPGDAAQVAQTYTQMLAQCAFLMPDALAFVQRVSARVPVYLVTNGLADVQRGRLARSAIAPYIRDIVISQEVGAQKPDPRMLRAALARAGHPDPRTVLMLGDSLSSDIQGAINAGIDSCYLNPEGLALPAAPTPTYQVRTLPEAEAFFLPAAATHEVK